MMSKASDRYLNIDFEKDIDYQKLIQLFLDRVACYKSAILMNSELFSNLNGNTEKASIFWTIDYIDEYTDIKLRSSIEFAEDVELLNYEFCKWLHEISRFFNTKIYVEIQIPSNPLSYYMAWCINGNSKSLVFDAGDVFENPEFAYCEPVIDMTKYL